MLWQSDVQVVAGLATDDVGHEWNTKVEQQSGTMLTTPQSVDCPCCEFARQISCNPRSLKPLPYKARNDYRACWHATWSEPEGSSHSGNIVCRGVAGGVASITLILAIPLRFKSKLLIFSQLPMFIAQSMTAVSQLSKPPLDNPKPPC